MHKLDHAFREAIGALARASADLPRREELGDTMAVIDRLAASSSFAAARGVVRGGIAAVTAGMFAVAGGRAFAEPLNPMEFPSTGNVTLTGHVYFNTLTADVWGDNLPLIHGTVHANHVAVNCFDNLTITSAAVIHVMGPRPLALLSRGAMNIRSTIDVSGASGTWMGGQLGGWGIGGVGIAGGGEGGSAGTEGGTNGAGAGGGGWGRFPDGALVRGEAGGFGGFSAPVSGIVYGNLFERLEGGSGGGAFVHALNGRREPGAAGGGAIELGAMASISIIEGGIVARGGMAFNDAGAGSGGGVLIHAPTVTCFASIIDVRGGNADDANPGAGGRVAIQGLPIAMPVVLTGGGRDEWDNLTGAAGTSVNVQPQVSAIDLDFGQVAVGETRTMFLALTNATVGESRVSGRFGAGASAFTREGEANFSGLKSGRSAACAYKFTPTSNTDYSVTVLIQTDAGTRAVTLRGRGGVCGSGDFNGDGDFGTDQDIEAFFRVLAGGGC